MAQIVRRILRLQKLVGQLDGGQDSGIAAAHMSDIHQLIHLMIHQFSYFFQICSILVGKQGVFRTADADSHTIFHDILLVCICITTDNNTEYSIAQFRRR